jgi:enoyl-CoA hydratase/carnithine racemase
MAKFDTYKDRYRFVRLERNDGILELTIHRDGNTAAWSAHAGGLHDELGQAFYDVGRDIENRVVILTGTGDEFLTEFDWSVPDPDMGTPIFWDRIWKEGKDLLMNLLDIEVPVIGAVNGPVFIHSELPTMSDIVLAAEHASFADKAHSPLGVVPGDGVHIWWQMLLGPNRGRHFLLTGEEIGASEAKALGFVAEVLPRERLLDRARELARMLAGKPTGMLRGTRAAFVQHIKRRMLDDLGYGLQLEAMGALAAQHAQAKVQATP